MKTIKAKILNKVDFSNELKVFNSIARIAFPKMDPLFSTSCPSFFASAEALPSSNSLTCFLKLRSFCASSLPSVATVVSRLFA